MAIIQYTALINQIRGKVNGSVLSKSKTAFTLIKKAAPRKPKSISQSGINVGFGANANAWNSLSEVEKANWLSLASGVQVYNRLGDLVNITAYNFYQLASGLLAPTGSATALLASGLLTSPYQISVELDTLEIQDIEGFYFINEISFTITILSTCVDNCTGILYLHQPTRNISSILPSDKYRIGTFSVSSGESISTELDFSFSDFQPPKGLHLLDNYNYGVSVVMVNNSTKNFTGSSLSPLVVIPFESPVPMPTLTFLDGEGQSLFYSTLGYAVDVTIIFSRVANGFQSSRYTMEVYFRGFNLVDNQFTPDRNDFVGVYETTQPTATESYTNNSNINDSGSLAEALNTFGTIWNPQLGEFWVLFSVRLISTVTGAFSDWYNIALQKYDS